jgi:hypothetical protein
MRSVPVSAGIGCLLISASVSAFSSAARATSPEEANPNAAVMAAHRANEILVTAFPSALIGEAH